MPEKLEEIMKKIHILLAECEQIAYSSEDVIVPKKKLFALLEQLNYVVYEIMEQYEVTLAARNRAVLQEERKAREIQEDARLRAEEVYAASLLYTEDMLQDMKIITDMMYRKTKDAYDELLQNYEERMNYLRQNEDELLLQMGAMAESKMYFKIIQEKQKEKEAALEREEARKKVAKKKQSAIETVNIEENEPQTESEEETKNTNLESTKSNQQEESVIEQQENTEQETKQETKQEIKSILAEEKIIEKPKKKKQPPAQLRECVGEVIDEGIDEYTAKLSSQLVITVHERPQVPEGFTKKKDKRAMKIKPEVPDEEIEIAPEEIVDYNEIPEVPQFSTEDLDKEYFDWQEENRERTGEKIERGKVKGQKRLARWKK